MLDTSQTDLFEWLAQPYEPGEAKPWKPEPLDHDHWPPDYKAVYAWRLKQLARMRSDPNFAFGARVYYKTHKAEFIMHWIDTYDPRVKGPMKWMPFVFFKRQSEFIEFLEQLINDQESGLVEKCRDFGLTWLCVAYSITTWLFEDDAAIGWGSRKEDLVDKLGDPDSIFEKMRMLLKRLPKEFLPSKFTATFMKILNEDNGSVITGESGDNIGRGGRKSFYFKDESAHYERPELIEAALGDNTNVQIDISSVNGVGNPFYNKRENGVDWYPGAELDKGKTRVFVADWREHPAKTIEWYTLRKAKWEGDGMAHIFAQEVDRNYSAAISNAIIPMEWINAAVDAHLKIKWIDERGFNRIGISDDGMWGGALDVADGGDDRNALAIRQGIIIRSVDEWGVRDVGVTARRTRNFCRPWPGIVVQYDSVGMGAAVKAEYNRLLDEKVIKPEDFEFAPWNAGAAVQRPFDRVVPDDDESPRNKDFFANMKAQAWWALRMRFWRTFQNITLGVMYDPDEMISIDSAIPLIQKLKKELAQPTISPNGAMKQIVDKKPDGTKSPNLADAIVMMMFPIETNYAMAGAANYG